MVFWILIGLDGVAALATLYFFFVGLGDGSVSAFNGGLWAALLLGVAAVVGGGLLLRQAGRPRLGNAVLAVLAVPAALYGLFILLVVASGTSWS